MAETGQVESYLKTQKPVAARFLRIALASGLGNGLIIIAQAYVVARIVSAVLIDKAGLADVAAEMAVLLPLILARSIVIYVGEVAAASGAIEVKRKLRAELLDHVLALGPVRLSGYDTGALATTMTDSVEAIEPYFARYLPSATLAALLPIAILAAIGPSDWVSAVVLLVTAPLIPVFMIMIGHGAEQMNQRQWSRLVRMSGHLLDVIQGLPTLKLFNASRREAAVVSQMAEAYRQDTMGVLRIAFLSSLALEFLATVSIAMIAVFIGFRLLWGEMTFINGFFVLLLAPEFYGPLRSLGAHYHARMEAIGAAQSIVDLMALPKPRPHASARRTPAISPPHVAFIDVSVTFDGGRRALDRLSFEVKPGERIAIIGPSGAGKSTVFNLLLGFLQPDSGEILINGEPLADLDGTQWLKLIAWLPQRPHIFGTSVLDNVALAPQPQDQQTRARAAEAVRRAHASDLIARLPNQWQTRLGDGGVGLSGGEVQRIALARALYRQPQLVLLDEPTAHLDRDTQTAVLAATAELTEGPTSLTIAHRLETVRSASRILVLEKGRLVEGGSHCQLIGEAGLYAHLVGADAGSTAARVP